MRQCIEVSKGWFIVQLVEGTKGILGINKITPITHKDSVSGCYMNNERVLKIDPDTSGHAIIISFIMDPQGRLYGRNEELLYESIYELYLTHSSRVLK